MSFQETARGLKIGLLAVFLHLGVCVDGLWAHSSDFVFARWSQDAATRRVELSLSVQVSDNPNLESRQQAIEVLTSLMQLSRNGSDGIDAWVPLSQLAEVSIETGTSFPADSPVPIGGGVSLEQMESGVAESDGGEVKEHEVITLNWTWLPTADEKQISFLLPADSQQNVIFWWAQQVGAEVASGVALAAGKEVPWQILLGGDESFVLDLLPQKMDISKRVWKISLWFKSLTTLVSVAGLLFGFYCYGRPRSQRAAK
ncbi:MAG: hypothetical protein L3J39_13240 [Verrucomicrobiales bacterium]|nr:hypothetical protein [Verrucomicrobiales bacterium]